MGRQRFIGFYVLKDKTCRTIKGDIKILKSLFLMILGIKLIKALCQVQMIITGPNSAVGNVSGNRWESNCRSRGSC